MNRKNNTLNRHRIIFFITALALTLSAVGTTVSGTASAQMEYTHTATNIDVMGETHAATNTEVPSAIPTGTSTPTVEPVGTPTLDPMSTPTAGEYVITIQFNDTVTDKQKESFVDTLGGTVVDQIEQIDTVVVEVPKTVSVQAVDASSLVAAAEPEFLVSALDTPMPNDPRFIEQWGVSAIGAPAAWALMPSNAAKVKVAVLDSGVTLVAAAGNSGKQGAVYPAAYAGVIAVGSVDSNLQRSTFSNYGDRIDVWAPGWDVLATRRDGTYGLMTGTSFAVPFVSGALAIYQSLGWQFSTNHALLNLGGEGSSIQPPTPTPTPTSSNGMYTG